MKLKTSKKNKVSNSNEAGSVLVMILLVTLLLVSPLKSYTSSSTLNIGLVTPQSLPSAEAPSLNLTYTTRTYLIDTPVESGDVIAGDHVTLKAAWSPDVNTSRLEVHAPAIPTVLSVEENSSTIEIDTRGLGNNATCTIIATTWLANGSMYSFEFKDVYIGNYFVPEIVVLTPNGNENWTSVHNITWMAFDKNHDDEFLFDVSYSSDSGSTFVPLVSGTNLTWFEWDVRGLNLLDTYIIRVRVTDGIYYSIDQSDSTFTAGTVVTTTTSPTPTPTTTGPGLEPRIIAFVVILLISSTIMALVVYYTARKWF